MTARVSDYPTLAQAILDFSHRTDIANFQDYMIQFAELKIYRDIFSLNMGDGIKAMETPFIATLTGCSAVASITVTLTTPVQTGNIAVGETVTGPGITTTITVATVSGSPGAITGFTVSAPITVTAATLTFSPSLNASTGTLPVPAGYLSLKAMQVSDGNSDTFDLLYKDPQWIYSNYPIRQPTGLPVYVARDGTNFVFGPFPDSGYAISGTYYGQAAPLTSTNTITWMTTLYPDLILSACMLECQPFLKDQNGMQMWAAIYQSKMTGLIDLDKSDRFAAGNMTIEVE